MRPEEMFAQPPGIGVAYVVDPALHAGVEFGERDEPRSIGIEMAFEPTRKVHRVAALEQPMRRMDDEAQPGDAAVRWQNLRLGGVDREPLVRQARDQRLFPFPQRLPVVAAQREVA